MGVISSPWLPQASPHPSPSLHMTRQSLGCSKEGLAQTGGWPPALGLADTHSGPGVCGPGAGVRVERRVPPESCLARVGGGGGGGLICWSPFTPPFLASFSFTLSIPVSTLLSSSCHNFYLCQEGSAPVFLSLYLSPSPAFFLNKPQHPWALGLGCELEHPSHLPQAGSVQGQVKTGALGACSPQQTWLCSVSASNPGDMPRGHFFLFYFLCTGIDALMSAPSTNTLSF